MTIESRDNSGLHINSTTQDKSLLTLQRTTDNTDEIGIAFQNSGDAHGGTIYLTDQFATDIRYRDAITIATVGNEVDVEDIEPTLTLGNNGQLLTHEYGQGNFTDTAPAYLLAVQADGDVVEYELPLKKEITQNAHGFSTTVYSPAYVSDSGDILLAQADDEQKEAFGLAIGIDANTLEYIVNDSLIEQV